MKTDGAISTIPSIYRCQACSACPDTHEVILWDCLPVPSFGNPNQAKVATISINPSDREFYKSGYQKDDSQPLCQNQRLPMLIDYGVKERSDLNDTHLGQAQEGQHQYFTRKSYRWFNDFDRLLKKANPIWSYESGTVTHIDIIACATHQWNSIKNEQTKLCLQQNCQPHFLNTLMQLQPSCLVLLNGRTTWNVVESAVRLNQENSDKQQAPDKKQSLEWSTGNFALSNERELKYIAWNLCLKYITFSLRETLVKLLKLET